MERRTVLRNISAGSLATILPIGSIPHIDHTERKFFHSVCRWCFSNFSLEELCDMAKDAGIQSIELLNPDEWDVVQKRGLKVALSNGSSLGIQKGWNTIKNHGQLQADLLSLIPR